MRFVFVVFHAVVRPSVRLSKIACAAAVAIYCVA